MENESEDKGSEKKEWEVERLACSIKDVEMAKKNDPELYSAALSKLKEEASAISSIADLKKVAKKKMEGDDE